MNNYYNRIVLSVLIPEIKGDLHISDIQYSYILGAFQIAYMFGMILSGKFIDWIGTRIGYMLAILFWSLAACFHAIAGSAFSLAFWRFLLGVSEAGNFPAAIKAVAEWFPQRERSFATSLFNSGPHIAMVTGVPIIAFLTHSLGWRWAFLTMGMTGFIIVMLWPILYRKRDVTSGSLAEKFAPVRPELAWRKLLVYRETWGIMLAKFFTDAVWWFYIFWLPNYLNTQRGFNISKIALAIPLIYAIAIVIGIITSWFPGYLMQRGVTPYRARKLAMFLCAMCLPFTPFAVVVDNVWASVLLVSLACGAHTGWANNTFTLVSDQFPPEVVASVTGLGGFAGAIGGLLFSTVAVGYIVTYLGYVPIFVLMGLLHPLGMLCIHVLVKKSRAVEV